MLNLNFFHKSSIKRFLALSFILVIAAGLIGGCSTSASTQNPDRAMAPMADMPEAVQQAPATVREAYQFAVANPDLVSSIPCYCGCGAVGHTSNYSCYVQGKDAAGKISFDEHALGCSICVDITQDAMRLQAQGKSTPDIRAYIDETYGKYGPSNMP